MSQLLSDLLLVGSKQSPLDFARRLADYPKTLMDDMLVHLESIAGRLAALSQQLRHKLDAAHPFLDPGQHAALHLEVANLLQNPWQAALSSAPSTTPLPSAPHASAPYILPPATHDLSPPAHHRMKRPGSSLVGAQQIPHDCPQLSAISVAIQSGSNCMPGPPPAAPLQIQAPQHPPVATATDLADVPLQQRINKRLARQCPGQPAETQTSVAPVSGCPARITLAAASAVEIIDDDDNAETQSLGITTSQMPLEQLGDGGRPGMGSAAETLPDELRQLDISSSDAAFRVFVLDLETTGLSFIGERIMELAVVDVASGQHYSTLVNPGYVKLGKTAMEVTGITQQQVQAPEVPSFAAALPALLQFVQRMVGSAQPLIAAHNGHKFDMPFLVNECTRAGVQLPGTWRCLDTMELSRKGNLQEKLGLANVKMGTLCEHFGVHSARHRALGDARDLAALLPQLLKVAAGLSMADLAAGRCTYTWPLSSISVSPEVVEAMQEEVMHEGVPCVTMLGFVSCCHQRRIQLTPSRWGNNQLDIFMTPATLNTGGPVRLVLLLRNMRIKQTVTGSKPAYREGTEQPAWTIHLTTKHGYNKGLFEAMAAAIDQLSAGDQDSQESRPKTQHTLHSFLAAGSGSQAAPSADMAPAVQQDGSTGGPSNRPGSSSTGSSGGRSAWPGRGRGAAGGRAKGGRGSAARTAPTCLRAGNLPVGVHANVQQGQYGQGMRWVLQTCIKTKATREPVEVQLIPWGGDSGGCSMPPLTAVKDMNLEAVAQKLPAGADCDVLVVAESLWQSAAGRGVKLVAQCVYLH